MQYDRDKGFIHHHFSNEKKSSAGFTIIETFVAISILLSSIAGPLVLISNSLQSATFAKQRLAATYLAIEGVELVRHVRDNNLLAEDLTPLTTGLLDCYAPEKCMADVPENTLVRCDSSGGCLILQRNTVLGFHSHNQSGSEWVDTIYTREVQITPTGTDEIEVKSTVSWIGNVAGGRREVVITDHLLNWF